MAVIAEQYVDGVASFASYPRTFIVARPPPIITPIGEPIVGRHALTITRVASGSVTLQMETVDGAKVDGTFRGSDTTRTFTPTAPWSPPGEWRIRVLQQVGGSTSKEYSGFVTLTVFSKPVITFPTSATVIRVPRHAVTGTGLRGARVTLYHQNQGTSPLGSVDVLNDQTWNIPASALDRNFWMADPFNLMAIQRLGTAVSEWSDVVGVPVIFKPIIDGVTVNGLKPTVRGSGGLKGAALQIWISGGQGGVQLTTTVRDNGTWEVAATVDWAVKTHTITARQITPVSKIESDWSDTLSFTIADPKPPKPAITPIAEPIEGQRALTITGVAAGTVTLTMLTEAGGTVAGTFAGTGATRTFTPTAAWAPPGEVKVKVVQTVGGVPSDASDLVTLKVKPAKPAITPIPQPIEGQHALTITGVAAGTVTLTMQTGAGGTVAGTFTGTGTTRTFMPTAAWAPPGTQTVKVVQKVGDVPSDPSALEILRVKAAPPFITPPSAPIEGRSELTITGVAQTGTVTLTMQTASGVPFAGAFTGSGATRTFAPTLAWAPPGEQTVKVVQKVNGVLSDDSAGVVLKVKPPKPAITPIALPIEGQHALTITGIAAVNVTLTMQTGAGGTVLGDFTGTGATRIFTPAAAWTPPGEQTVKVVQTVGGVPSDPSDVVTLKVRPPKPGIEPPGAPIEASQPLTVMGIYSDAVTLKMLDDVNNEVTGSFTGSGAQRDFTPDPSWAEGEHQVKVVQTLQNITSAPSDLCSFSVEVSLKPPFFEVPVAGSNSSSSPQISGASEPFADVMVRHVGSQEQLFHGPADADGYWAFVVKAHLSLGPNSLQAMQTLRGQSSVWGEEHPFTVIRTPVSVPTIVRPQRDSTVNPVLWFSGSGVVNAQVNIRVKQDGVEKGSDRVPVNGSRNWTSRPSFRLPPGITYTLEVQQQYGAEESGWTVPAVPFKVSASTFEFAEAGPVIGQPVVSNEEGVWLRLRVRAVSADTGLGVGGLEVRWYLDEQDVLATTLTEADGWTRYRYRPATAGEHTVWADMSAENAGVAVVQPFMLTAVENDVWAREFDLLIDGERLDLTEDIVFWYGEERLISLVTNPDSPLIGATTVSLEALPGTDSSDFTARPPLGTLVLVDHSVMTWLVEPDTELSGLYGLKLSSPKLPDRQLPIRVISKDLANEVEVFFDGVATGFGKGAAYLCHGAKHILTLKPKPGSPMLNKNINLTWHGDSGDGLGIVTTPSVEAPRFLGEQGLTWEFNCVNSKRNGSFSLRLVFNALVSSDYNLSLGDYKVKVIDRDGPREIGGAGGRWRTGICVASEFTGNVVSVPVTVHITGKEPYTASTESNGWCYVYHAEDESAGFTLHNWYPVG
ncbi:hypothetical protein FX983_04994 [Pseudomonas frederiksbergensis]|uniref:Uncharacterized protein n=2 Tax=Pseudomonas frederiksbergensis TaxID=104087 RepID=A0A6L5BQC5_9PSED|nr:hypothetical protein FX983_04994 [Pseudomonas frederiksbergensis]